MTKEEYRDRFGRSEACKCTRCGEYFPCHELELVREPHGEDTPICPVCGCDDLEYDAYIEEEDEDE